MARCRSRILINELKNNSFCPSVAFPDSGAHIFPAQFTKMEHWNDSKKKFPKKMSPNISICRKRPP